MIKNLKSYLYLTIISAVAVILILNEFLLYALILLGTGFLAFGLWQQLIKSKDKKISELETQLHENRSSLDAFKEEVEELRNRKLKITDIKSILDLGLLEVNTNFIRTWNKKFTLKKQDIHFIGALKIDIIAKYGIDLKDLKFKEKQGHNELIVANANPKFLSFSDLNYIWEISEILEYKKPFLGSKHWKKSTKLGHIGRDIKEDLQTKIHREVLNGPEEMDWVLEPLKKQIKNTLYVLLGNAEKKITLAEKYDNSFIDFENLPENLINKPGKQINSANQSIS
ncbi:MAG: hypothetical protein U9N85_05720 [Bacteroidota bacterium]|nr:hypothetical protein [Bacteroidota bacterium]